MKNKINKTLIMFLKAIGEPNSKKLTYRSIICSTEAETKITSENFFRRKVTQGYTSIVRLRKNA